MKKFRRLIALLLCMIMLIPSQGMTVLAEAAETAEETAEIEGIDETERISELLPLEVIEDTEDETPRIEETLELEPLKDNTSDEGIIYWNPGGVLPEELATASNAKSEASDPQTATASNARTATASNAKKGNDDADGKSPSTPVRTLAKAIERAEELMAEEGLLPTDITIYAMNPMEIADGQLYALNGGNLSIKSWPGRSYNSDVIFYVNGGQLTMMNARLASGNPERADDEARLIYVRGGAFQMGQNVTLEGRVVLDYRNEAVETEWATPSNAATATNATMTSYALDSGDQVDSDAAGSDVLDAGEDKESSFDLNEYILDSDEDSIELIEDSTSASTWRDPIIELMEGFENYNAGEYLLELLEDGSLEEIELVKTLYSDAETEEDFLGFFTLTENTDFSWNLQVETQAAAQVRNTSLFSTLSAAEVLTSKTLVATRAMGNTIYWNPGGSIVIGGTTYPAGRDEGFSGLTALAPLKTWEKAVERAEGGMIICMQTLDLVGSNAGDYLPTVDGVNYLLKSSSTATMAALSSWSSNPQPVISVPAGKILTLQDIEFVGVNGTSAQAIVCNQGDIIINENVIAETGYIQITAFKELEAHPVKVTGITDISKITLFFSGINNSYDYCYMDVVVPYGELAASITEAEAIGGSEAKEAQAELVGSKLLGCFQLHSGHSDGTSRFNWILRQDTYEDGLPINPQNLELYAEYYFDAIYLDGVKGNDSYYGATCQYPVRTWAKAQERWAYEMKKSVDARWAAYDGTNAAYIEEFYPLPKTIYICGTVEVNKSEAWDLWAEYQRLNPEHEEDYNGKSLMVEVVPHMDIPYEEGSATLNHTIPVTLVNVTAAGDLTINDVTFRNITDDAIENNKGAESVTIRVESGKLTLTGKTLLTGERKANGSITAKEVTLGTHVKVLSGGSFVMGTTAKPWSGAIEKRRLGVEASGKDTTVTMNSGSIRENNSFDQVEYDANRTGHEPGAGVVLKEQAEFTMNGGEITKNTVYQYGAGVYMVGTGTSFIMKNGVISENKMNSLQIYKGSTTPVRGYGIGIYAGTGTKLTLGDDSNPLSDPLDALIEKNVGYCTSGVGIWSDGAELSINRATISGNYTNAVTTSSSTAYSCYGIGIYVGANVALNMDGGQVIGNYSSSSSYGHAQGAGIYFASSSKSHTIKGSTISGNKVGYEYSSSSSYSAGGGIYMAGGAFSLGITEDSKILDNQAYYGGGIFVNSTSTATAVTIKDTRIQENRGVGVSYSGSGYGGGIYFTGSGSLTLLDGVEIIKNNAKTQGGGIYLAGSCHLYMMSDTSGAIQINENESGSGGGIYQTSSTIHAKNAEINGNKAATGAGIYAGSVGYFRDVKINENQATSNGGGLYLAGTYYMSDCAVTDNEAQGSGGGFFVTGTLHLTETSLGKFNLSGNHAANGGGLYINSGNFFMDIAGEIQNSAAEQGSNLYLCAGNSYILSGYLKQPEISDRIPGVYNIYVNNTAITGGRRYFDMSSVTAERKDAIDSGVEPEVIYLNTANSYLTYLNSPPNDTRGTFPIDLNEEVFKVGSVVVKPVDKASVTVSKPNDALAGVTSGTTNYSLQDASENLEYFSGGNVPRRTWLGGFKVTSTLTNVTLVAEGIYLSGTGNNSNSGASPDEAVKDFEVAKQKLQKIIEDTAVDEDSLPDDKKKGFAPFIYICGQVDIASGEPEWELEYDALLFTETNKYYISTEEALTGKADPAQVRRFASFVNKPMIKVGDGSSDVAFSTGKIIINGMAEAVITEDQDQKSPVIEGTKETKITLNTGSQITNNYYSGLDIRGDLVLTGAAGESDIDNKQIYNHHGAFVRLYESGTVNMEGEARIFADAAIKRVGTLPTYGIQAMGASTKITMTDNSAIIHESGDLLGGSSTGYGIYADQNSSSIKMLKNASIQNHESTMRNGIYIAGNESSLEMNDTANITAVDASISYSIQAAGSKTAITMSDDSKIVQSGTRTTSNYGIWQGGTDVVVTMEKNASIACTYAGIWMQGTRPRVEMKDEAQIFNDDTLQTTHGIYLYNTSAVTSPTIVMTENASIHGSEKQKMSYAIYATYYSSSGTVSNLTVEMNMNGGAKGEDAAKLYNCTTGYFISQVNGASLSMGKNASITAVTHGYYQSSYTGTNNFSLLMQENSRIANSTYGMYFTNSILVPVNITLEGEAAIEQNTHGIYEYAGNGYGLAKLNLQMSGNSEGNSRISGNSQYGIYLLGRLGFTEANGYYHKITLDDSAMIGGEEPYKSGIAASGNGYAGIYANSPIQLTMNGTSKISGNGSYNYNTSSYANGVYLERYTSNSSYYRAGTAKITLNENASICNNKGGVYVSTISETSYPNYPNTCVIELNGIKEESGTETLTSPSIRDNTDAIYLGGQGTLRLKGGAVLGDTTYSADGRSLDCYGSLELDGRSTIEGRLYMRDGNKPITMTHAASGAASKYNLYLAEGFLGQIVVKPEKPDGNPAEDMTDVTDQITYFNKIGADGLAADKRIVANAPNLVLQGENNVYLSGSGSDSNNGNSKATPVRTFKRAKELLEGGENGGYFESDHISGGTSGANIIICTSTVSVQAGDNDWSFDDGGYVTNARSKDTWKPLVIRDESFTGNPISIINSTGYANSVTFKNITIDGASEKITLANSGLGGQLLTVNSGVTAILKDGAVLQNNKVTYTSNILSANTVGVYVNGGTLEIDGGTIQGMVRERTGTSVLTSAHYLASAIYCVGNSSYPGKVIMKSGQITGNQVLGANLTNTGNRCGAIYLDGVYANMEMSGGQITDNVVSQKGAAFAGAIFSYQGTLTMSGGTIRDNQGGRGSAIYHYGTSAGGNLILSGGKISGNSVNNVVTQSFTFQGEYSPIYIANYGMELKGGAADIQDSIYLASNVGIIKVSGQIYQANRRYRVYLNQGAGSTQFKKGSVVVQPDRVNVTDATPYLSYFDVRTSPYVLDQGRVAADAGVNQSAVVVAGVKENQCLILMKAVYLDSKKSDSNNGLTPATAVKTFATAKTIGEIPDGTTDNTNSYNHYIIYVSGKAINTAAEMWSLPELAYMCRYTGFAVYSDNNGTATTDNLAYYDFLIEPASDLTLQDIAIYGRRAIDTILNNGDSLVYIKSGITVNVQSDQTGTILADNYNRGNYIGEDGQENLTSKGGAFHVEAGGILQMEGGVIQNTEAASGSAIYLGANETNLGRLILTGSPEVSGKVYLDGTGTVTAAYIEPKEDYKPSHVLQISIGNDYNGRPVIQYPLNFTPGADELEYYLFDDAIKAMYDVVNRGAPSDNILELNMRQVIYLDGQHGDDNNDGSTPAKAYKTLKKVFESIGTGEDKYGIVVFVVDTVDVSGGNGSPAEIEMMNILVKDTNGNNHYEGYYWDSDIDTKIPIKGQVYFKRYAQPKKHANYEGFDTETLMKTLFDVKDGGTLIMRGIYLDGHSQDVDNSTLTLVADGVTAMSPLVTVEKGGTLKCLPATGVNNGVSTATLFTNNINGNPKTGSEPIGKLNGSLITEGSGAGIELLEGGKCYLQFTEFSNLQLVQLKEDEIVVGGTDVYSNGDLHVSMATHFSGTVYLEGFGTAEAEAELKETSRYITVDEYGEPVKTNFQVLMRDPYMGRTVVQYEDLLSEGIEPPVTDIAYYRLEERVKDYFCLNKRSNAEYIFELQVPVAVYIDGIDGDDGTDLEDPMGRAVGSTPEYPVKSLKRAFELLYTRGGNTIYVVNTVQMATDDTEVTGMSYKGRMEGTVLLGSTTKVKITRYIQPDFAYNAKTQAEIDDAKARGYYVSDFTGVLLNVADGASVKFSNGVYFDGHSEPKTNTEIREYGEEAVVSREGEDIEAKAPLITVDSGGTLTLSEGTTLLDNNNTYAVGDTGQDGGAMANRGTVNVDGALFKNNKAMKGSVVYQGGTFNIQSNPENLSNHDNAFYLTTSNGTNHVIRMAVAIPDELIESLAFDVDMDNAVKGRPVVRFTDSSAYSPNTGADAEHEHFKLGSTVGPELFLVESETDPELLELQNWEILKVEVPTSIYLVMSRKGTNDASTKLSGIMKDAPAGDLFSAPEYKIENKGNYDVKVSISGFENQTAEVGIDTALYPLMNLTATKEFALSQTDLYLAVEGLDTLDANGNGFGMKETSLKPYEETPTATAPAVLGTLSSKATGNFTFKGAVGYGFMEKYLDLSFPLEGSTGAEAQTHMDGNWNGTSSTAPINARAKYLLRYKVETVPSRRESTAASDSTTP